MEKKFMEVVDDVMYIHENNIDRMVPEFSELIMDDVPESFEKDLADLIKSRDPKSYEEAIDHFDNIAHFLRDQIATYEVDPEDVELSGMTVEEIRNEAYEEYIMLFMVIESMKTKSSITGINKEIGKIVYIED